MKKVLSFVLVLAMILGSVATVFAAKPVAITADNTVLPFKDAPTAGYATVLRDIGALEGKGDDIVDLEGTLTRAEAATLVVRALGLDDLGKVPQATKFADVKKDIWYSGYVAVAYAKGIIQGRDAKTFAPEESISLNEAIALICQTLGYNSAHLAGAWPMNYINAANGLKLLNPANYFAQYDDLTVGMGDKAATRADFCKLLFNALDCPQVVWVDDTEGAYVGGDSLVTRYFAGQTLFQAITGENGKVENYYKVAADDITVADLKTFKNGLDVSAFLGKKVYVLSKYTKAGTAVPMAVFSDESLTLTGKFTAVRGVANTFNAFVTTDGTTYKFEKSATGVDAKGQVTTSYNFDYVYKNGEELSSKTVALESTVPYTISVELNAKGEINDMTAISYWEVGAVDVVNATQAAYLLAGDFAKINSEQLAGKTFAMTAAAVGSYKNVYLEGSCVVEGAVTALADIKEGDVVEVYTASNVAGCKDASAHIVKVVVTRNTVTGAITRVNADNSLVVAGTTYKKATITDTAFDLEKFGKAFNAHLTSEFALYLNAAGQYVFAELVAKTVDNPVNYAFVTYVSDDVVTAQPSVAKYPFAYIGLTVPGEKEVIYDTLKLAGMTGAALAASFSDLMPGVGDFVAYTLKSDKLASIEQIDDETLGFDEANTINANGIIAGKGVKVTADTKLFKVVTDTDLANPKNYKVLKLADVLGKTFDEGFAYVAEKGVAKVVVFEDTTVQGKADYVTFAAFQSYYYDAVADDVKVTFLTLDGEKTFAAEKADKWTQFSVGGINLEAGAYVELTDDAVIDYVVDKVSRAAVENAVLSGTTLKVAGKTFYTAEKVQTWVLDLAAAVPANARFAVKDFDEAVADVFANALLTVDFDEDSEIDLILVINNATEANVEALVTDK